VNEPGPVDRAGSSGRYRHFERGFARAGFQSAQGGEVGLRCGPLAFVDIAQLLYFVNQRLFLIQHEYGKTGGVDRQHRKREHTLRLKRHFGHHGF
jgi:hypothetical protein